MAKYSIAILYICTGQYDVFWKDFFLSAEQFLCKKSEKHYFVFSDSTTIYGEDSCDRIHLTYQERLGWPYDTLMRFKIFSQLENQLEKYDYIFFFNANIRFLKEITEEEFLPFTENFAVLQHPGFIGVPPIFYPYEHNRKSAAYIPIGKGQYYFMGSLNGGKTVAYIKLIKTLRDAVDSDLKNEIIAKWHDESQLNKYLFTRTDVKILSPVYGYPEGWDLPYNPQILIIDKDKIINTSDIKNYNSSWVKIKKKIASMIRSNIIKRKNY